MLRTMLLLRMGLLAVAALVATSFGPFDAAEGAAVLTVGMTLVRLRYTTTHGHERALHSRDEPSR